MRQNGCRKAGVRQLVVAFLLLNERLSGIINLALAALGVFLGGLGGLIPLALLTTRPVEEVSFRFRPAGR